MKRLLAFALLCGTLLLPGCGKSSAQVLNVYNWGEYIDLDLIRQFEEETGIDVV